MRHLSHFIFFISLLIPFSLSLTSCGSIQELMDKEESQAKDRKMLESYIYPQKLITLKKKVLEALDNKREMSKAPTIVMNKSMGELKRDNRLNEIMRSQGFEYKGNYYIDAGLEINFIDSITVFTTPQAASEQIKDAVFKGSYHILEDSKARAVIADGALSYELIQTKNGGTQLRAYRLKKLMRGRTRVGVDWWAVLGGKLPFLLKEGAISWETSREYHAKRDIYAELEMYYLINKTHQE